MPRRREFDEAKLRELWPDTRLSLGQIASLLGMPRSSLGKIAGRLGLPPREHRPYDRDLLRRLWLFTTMTPQEIAFELGSSRQFVREQAKLMGLPRKVPEYKHLERDPTQEEIAERAAECRKRHLAEKRAEPHQRGDEAGSLRCFSYCGDCYVSAGLLS
jgi:hypothetical protein